MPAVRRRPAARGARPSTRASSPTAMPAGAQQHRFVAGERDDRRLDADAQAPPSRIIADARRRGRPRRGARSSGRCGRSGWPTARRCRARLPGEGVEQRARDRMRRHAQADAVLAAGDDVGDIAPRAAGSASAAPARTRRPAGARPSGIVARPARELRRRRRCARSPGGRRGDPWRRRSCARRRGSPASAPEAVDGLGREGDQRAAHERGRGAFDGLGRRRAMDRSSPTPPSARWGSCREVAPRPARIKSFCARADAGARAGAWGALGNERFSLHVGIGFGRSSGQGGRPDLRRGARCDSRPQSRRPGSPPRRWCRRGSSS